MSSSSREEEEEELPEQADYISIHGLNQLQRLLDSGKSELAVFSDFADVKIVSLTAAEKKDAPRVFAPRIVFVSSIYLYVFDKPPNDNGQVFALNTKDCFRFPLAAFTSINSLFKKADDYLTPKSAECEEVFIEALGNIFLTVRCYPGHKAVFLKSIAQSLSYHSNVTVPCFKITERKALKRIETATPALIKHSYLHNWSAHKILKSGTMLHREKTYGSPEGAKWRPVFVCCTVNDFVFCDSRESFDAIRYFYSFDEKAVSGSLDDLWVHIVFWASELYSISMANSKTGDKSFGFCVKPKINPFFEASFENLRIKAFTEKTHFFKLKTELERDAWIGVFRNKNELNKGDRAETAAQLSEDAEEGPESSEPGAEEEEAAFAESPVRSLTELSD